MSLLGDNLSGWEGGIAWCIERDMGESEEWLPNGVTPVDFMWPWRL